MPPASTPPAAALWYEALTQGSARDVESFLANGANPNDPVASGPTGNGGRMRLPLEWALLRVHGPERLAVLDALLAGGADVYRDAFVPSQAAHPPWHQPPTPLWQRALEEQGEPSAREATFRVIWKHHPELGRPKGVIGMGAPFNHPWVLAARLTTDALLDDLLASAPQEYVPDEVVRHLADRPLSWGVERLQRLLAFVPNRHEFALSVFDSALNTPAYQDSPLPVIQWALGVAPDLPSPTLDVFIEKAVLKGRADAFDALLAARPPRREMPWDRTPLVHTAVEWMLGHPPANRAAAPTPDLLARALAWGDPVEAPGKNGRTALHAIVSAAPLVLSLSRARHRAHLRRLANRLVEEGASWNTPDAAGNTPLSLAHTHAPFLATEWEKKNARALTRSLKAEMPSVRRLSLGRRRL